MDGDLVLPTGGWNGWSLRIYDLATMLTKGECVVWADMGKWEVGRYTESKQHDQHAYKHIRTGFILKKLV